jgi:NAD(P)-dependent dehydrogenase (short-subunit alcohol dehydrogenase family)
MTVLITGTTRGIGLELCKAYVARGHEVIAVCRVLSDALRALGIEVIEGVDVGASDAGERLRQALGDRPLDILINNAGVLGSSTLGSIDFDDVARQLQVNAIGPLRVTEALLPNLGAGAKVAMITSRMGSMTDNGSGGYYAYRMSKAALNAAGVSLAQDLRPRGIAVALLHPGFVQTQMVGFAGDISPQEAAERLIARIDALTLDTSGSFWHSNGELLPW